MSTQRVLGGAIRAIRERSGISLRRLAADVQISPGYLHAIETGQKQPGVEIRERIRHRLGVSLDAIAFDPAAAGSPRHSTRSNHPPAGAA